MGGVRFNRRHIRRGNRRPLFKHFDHIFSKPARVFTAFFLHRQIKSGQLDERYQQFLECIGDSLAASGASFFIHRSKGLGGCSFWSASWFVGFFDGYIFYFDILRIIWHGRDLSLLFLRSGLVPFFESLIQLPGGHIFNIMLQDKFLPLIFRNPQKEKGLVGGQIRQR